MAGKVASKLAWAAPLVLGGGVAVYALFGMHKLSNTAEEFVTAVHHGNYRRAYAEMDDAYRARRSLDAFRTTVSTNPYLHGGTDVTINETTSTGGATTARGTLSSSAGDVHCDFEFTSEHGHDAIANVVLAGAPVFTLGAH